MPTGHGFSHVGVSTHDMDATVHFYEEVLGFPHVVESVTRVTSGGTVREVYFEIGEGQFIVFMEAKDVPGIPADYDTGINRALGVPLGMYHFALRVRSLDDLESRRRHLESHRVEVTPIVDLGHAKSIFFFDPNGIQLEDAQRAAELSKCDLLTAMVGEFPELQGVMGRYYALHDHEPDEVADALAEQYLPRFAGDVLPATGAGLALAVADKLDTLIGIFAIGQKPTGTKDPFGLRRAALGVLRILIETGVALDLRELIRSALESVTADIARLGGKPPDEKLGEEIYDYMMERLRAWYLEGGGGISTEMFDAVLDTRPASPLDFDQRLRALAAFLKLPEAAGLTAANKRIANILRKAGDRPVAAIDVALQVRLFKRKAGRTTVNDSAQRGAVTFAERGERKRAPE